MAASNLPLTVQTVNVSRNGCCLLLKRLLSVGQKIHLQRGEEEAVGRVVGQTGICAEGNLFGIEVLNPGETSGGFGSPSKRNWRKARFACSSSAPRAKTAKRPL